MIKMRNSTKVEKSQESYGYSATEEFNEENKMA